MSVDLDSLLSQVPYQVRHRVKMDIIAVKATYKSLNPQLGTLIHNDGTESRLVLLTGTVPIRYMGHEYHIPIELFIPEVYPNLAPKIYVRPTPNMIVKPGHKHVDSSGLVYLPYLMSWVGVSSSLAELCKTLCGVFSTDPPLFSKPTTATSASHSATFSASATTTAASTTSSMAQYYAQLHGRGSTPPSYGNPASTSVSAAPVASASYASQGAAYAGVATAATASYTANTLGSSGTGHTQQAGQRRQELVRKVTLALQTELAVALTALALDMDREMEQQCELEYSRDNSVRAEQRALEAQQLECRTGLAQINEVKSKELDAWVLKMDPNAKLDAGSGDGDADDGEDLEEGDDASEGSKSKAASDASGVVDGPPEIDRLVAYDDISAQLVRLLAEQNAIEDAIYSLDHALAHGTNVLDVTTFLKKMRELGRKQFLCKLHIMKINGVLEGRAGAGRHS